MVPPLRGEPGSRCACDRGGLLWEQALLARLRRAGGGRRRNPAPLDSGTGPGGSQDTAQQVLQRAKKGSAESTGRSNGDVRGIFKELSNFCAAPQAASLLPLPVPNPRGIALLRFLPSFFPSLQPLIRPQIPVCLCRRVGFTPGKLTGVTGGDFACPCVDSIQGNITHPPDTAVSRVGMGSGSSRLQQGKLRLDASGKCHSQRG